MREHLVDHFTAPGRVGSHQRLFVRVELAGLQQNAIGNGDFSDVVQWRKNENLLDGFVGQLVSIRNGLRDDAREARHAVEVGAGLVIAGVSHVPCRLHRGKQRLQGGEIVDDGERDQMSEGVDLAQRFLAETVRIVGIEEEKAEQPTLVIHRHGVAGTVTLCGDALGMLVLPAGKNGQVVDDARLSLLDDCTQRRRIGQLRRVMRERTVFLAGEEKGLERVCFRVEDRRRNALNEWKVFAKRGVDRSYFVQEADVAVDRAEPIFVIEHEG